MAEPALPREAGARRRSLVTPEGVDLSLRLAESGQRVAAFLIDLLVMVGAMLLLTLLAILAAVALGADAIEAIAVVWLLGFFLVRNFYFILLETGPRAATVGKRAVGLRVVARSGARLTADSVIARNLMREIELYLPLSFIGMSAAEGGLDGLIGLLGFGWAAIFLFFPFFNRDRLRVGDLLAGTWVIHAPKHRLGAELLAMPGAAEPLRFTGEQLDAYGVFELQTLEKVLRTGNDEALATVSEAIRAKIGARQDGDDRAFLAAYYEAARIHMERGLLFGRRREHKHDR